MLLYDILLYDTILSTYIIGVILVLSSSNDRPVKYFILFTNLLTLVGLALLKYSIIL